MRLFNVLQQSRNILRTELDHQLAHEGISHPEIEPCVKALDEQIESLRVRLFRSPITFIVHSRHSIEASQPWRVPHALISIKTPGDPDANLPTNELTMGVLRLAFWDSDAKDFVTSHDWAEDVWDFVTTHKDQIELIVVHCDLGYSRSPAVAAALARGLGQDDAHFFKHYKPNMRVYRTLMNVIDPSSDYANDEG